MMETKIPFYNVLNMFLTGLVFIGGCFIIFSDSVATLLSSKLIENFGMGPEVVITVCVFAVAYEVGLIINRVGSVVIEPFLRWTKLIPFNNNYVLFNSKKKEYPIMSTLSREYALSRTGVVLFLFLLILSAVKTEWICFIVCVCITIVYFFSCRKHAKKIVDLMKDE